MQRGASFFLSPAHRTKRTGHSPVYLFDKVGEANVFGLLGDRRGDAVEDLLHLRDDHADRAVVARLADPHLACIMWLPIRSNRLSQLRKTANPQQCSDEACDAPWSPKKSALGSPQDLSNMGRILLQRLLKRALASGKRKSLSRMVCRTCLPL